MIGQMMLTWGVAASIAGIMAMVSGAFMAYMHYYIKDLVNQSEKNICKKIDDKFQPREIATLQNANLAQEMAYLDERVVRIEKKLFRESDG